MGYRPPLVRYIREKRTRPLSHVITAAFGSVYKGKEEVILTSLIYPQASQTHDSRNRSNVNDHIVTQVILAF